MSLEHALLGFLNYHPYTGYDLKKIFDTSVRHFWPADQSQIYRTLNLLTDEGYVEMEKVPQEDRPDRKVYHITDTGRAQLKKWLSGPPPLSSARSAPLIQVFFPGNYPMKKHWQNLKSMQRSCAPSWLNTTRCLP